jgi:hypothetical protein
MNGQERALADISAHTAEIGRLHLLRVRPTKGVSECNGDFASLLGIDKLECVFSFDFHRSAVD